MTTFPRSPRILKGGIVVMDPNTSAIQRIIALQYNPDTLSRTLQAQGMGDTGNRSEALRLKGPPVETIKLDAEIDAADQLEFPDRHPSVTLYGVQPQLAALETLLYPRSDQIQANLSLAQSGTLEIVPMEAPLTLFVWSRLRIIPVRLTEFSVTEEAFDTALNPLRVKVSLGMRVLSVDDLGFNHRGGNLFMSYMRQKEQLALLDQNGMLSALGLMGIP